MADYYADEQIKITGEALFDYLSDVSNLPKYFPRMTSAEPADGEAVRVTARLDDAGDGESREVQGEAWFHVDRDAMSLSWGSEGPNHYRGDLTVRGVGDNAGVAIHLSTVRVEGEEIQQALNETVANIKRVAEGGDTEDRDANPDEVVDEDRDT